MRETYYCTSLSHWHVADNRERVCTFEKGFQTHNSRDIGSGAFNQSFFLATGTRKFSSMHQMTIVNVY